MSALIKCCPHGQHFQQDSHGLLQIQHSIAGRDVEHTLKLLSKMMMLKSASHYMPGLKSSLQA